MCKCKFPEGMTIKPDGVHELDPCIYVTEQLLRNVTVMIDKCEKCGHYEITWFRQDNTEEVDVDEFLDVIYGEEDSLQDEDD
jgi:hypothetical protein